MTWELLDRKGSNMEEFFDVIDWWIVKNFWLTIMLLVGSFFYCIYVDIQNANINTDKAKWQEEIKI